MSQYVNRANIAAEFDPVHLTDALDDNRDGQEDEGLFERLAASVDTRILGFVERIRIRQNPPPVTWLRDAGTALMCALLFRRRGAAEEQNPFKKREDDVIDALMRMASGEATTGSARLRIKTIHDGEDVFS